MLNSLRAIDAICATSDSVGRKLIIYDEILGTIEKILEDSDPSYLDSMRVFKSNHLVKYYPDSVLLFAAFGDVHIHAREDVSALHVYKEDFNSVMNASYNGGVVFACDMPNNPIAPVDEETYLQKLKLSMKNSFALLPYAGVGPTTKPLSFLVPYKVYMGHSIGDLYFSDDGGLYSSMEHYKNQYVSFHCEDPIVLENNKEAKDHFLRRPLEAEVRATKLALELAKKFQLNAKLCHYSSGDGLEIIRKAKKEGVKITCEVTPQHLYFCQEELEKKLSEDALTQYQMNPPIRDRYNRELLFAALINGDIDYLATDHAPHSQTEKRKGMSGLTGLDTFGAFVTWLLVDKEVDPKLIAKICSENPGEFYNTFHQSWLKNSQYKKVSGEGFGKLKAGFSASFTLLDLTKPITITKEHLKTKAASSPFLGVTFPGSVNDLYYNGKIVKN